MFCFWCKFRFWANFFLTIGTNFSVKLSKLLSLCFDEHFDGKCFFYNSSSFPFRTLSETISDIVWKFQRKLVIIVSCVFRKHFEETDFSGKYLIPMYTRTMGEKVPEFLVIFQQTCPNRFLRVETNNLMNFFGKDLFFRFLVRTSSDVRKKHYRNVVKTNFYLLRKPVDEIYFFEFSNVFGTYSNFGRKFFRF